MVRDGILVRCRPLLGFVATFCSDDYFLGHILWTRSSFEIPDGVMVRSHDKPRLCLMEEIFNA